MNSHRKQHLSFRQQFNRNEYGHEGYLLYLLLSQGCFITFEKISNSVQFKTMKIIKVSFNETILLDRNEIENQMLNESHLNREREKIQWVEITINNKIFDILENYFHLTLTKKGPKIEQFGKLKMENITINERVVSKKEIIEEGFHHYEWLRNTFNNQENVVVH